MDTQISRVPNGVLDSLHGIRYRSSTLDTLHTHVQICVGQLINLQ